MTVAVSKKQWGVEITYADTTLYSARVLIVTEGNALPYLYHRTQDTTIFVSQGVVQITVEGRNKILNEGDSYHFPPKIMYRITALKGDATILEVGTKLEDDTVIIEE